MRILSTMDGNVAKAFGEVLRAHREAAGLSQQTLAFDCDLDRTFISLLERGKRQPSLTVVIALARGVGKKPSAMVSEVERCLDR